MYNGPNRPSQGLRPDYWLLRDFEYVQLLHDLAFFLEVEALAKKLPVPEYRAFSLFRAAYSLDSYDTTIARWLCGASTDDVLDYVPTKRIRDYLIAVQNTGTLPELAAFGGAAYVRARRLRSVRGLGPAAIAETLSLRNTQQGRLAEEAMLRNFSDTAQALYRGNAERRWQAPHIVPPLARLMHALERAAKRTLSWTLEGIVDAFTPISSPFTVHVSLDRKELTRCLRTTLGSEVLFRSGLTSSGGSQIEHQMGWEFFIRPGETIPFEGRPLLGLISDLDPLSQHLDDVGLQGDLHLHSTWSDGAATTEAMASAAEKLGLTYIFVTDHSRSSKLQGGLTPAAWLRQASALRASSPAIPVLQGLEVDILPDGTLDLPPALLRATALVIGSVHSSWTEDATANTQRIVATVESGMIDILGHPSSALLGKMGVPDYVRPAALVDWNVVFTICAEWRVAIEFNCFPSRFDLALPLLRKAQSAGCMISFGSDAHARSHLSHLRYGALALSHLNPDRVLNTFTLDKLTEYLERSRLVRATLVASGPQGISQSTLPFVDVSDGSSELLSCRISAPQKIPNGSTIVGIDLTAGEKLTGVCLLDGNSVETHSFRSDEEILSFIERSGASIISIDSPLGLPGGGESIDPSAGIVREAERDLASIGIPAYPALIDSMRNLTMRGIRLRRHIESNPSGVQVIESYPGAAQDILRIPRKQKGLENLRSGLRRLGLTGPGLDTQSHDEMDAITSAVVGRFFENGKFEPMGIKAEAQLIVPKVEPLSFDTQPVICLCGKTGAGKSVVARYLSVFYGFQWIRTRELIRKLLIEDQKLTRKRRLFSKKVDASTILEKDLQEFGAVILHEHGQEPLRKALAEVIVKSKRPVVVDSIRDISDTTLSAGQSLRIWFIHSGESQIMQRLESRMKQGAKRSLLRPAIDNRSEQLQRRADDVLPNNSSLEALRWKVDDTLFKSLSLNARQY